MEQTTSKTLEFELPNPTTKEIEVFKVEYTVKSIQEVAFYDEYGNGSMIGDWDYSIDSLVMTNEESKEFDYINKDYAIKEAINQIENKES